ncbi:MAG TPA: GntR family transcriptional regulator [Candidatus Limnocylindrales bacterium]|nr:GntR family transcriptional regulator [Candidatus Limnocylindrales bacterium]
MSTPLTPIGEQRSLQERTYQSMRLAILEGRYVPGERIYEAEVAQALGVSRNPVREAVRRLQQDGLLDVRAHYGIYVTRIPVEEIDDIYRIRAALEGTAAGFATARMTDEDIAELETIVGEQQKAVAAAEALPRAPVSVVQADHFHHAIHVGARSPRLLAMLEQLYAQVTHFRNLTLRLPGRAAVSAAGHAEILRAIQARDADSAETLMRGHIDDARHALVRHMDEIEKQPEEGT